MGADYPESSISKNADVENYGTVNEHQIQKHLEGKPYGVQKVYLMKTLGNKWDRMLTIFG
jgi:hypothetical protein